MTTVAVIFADCIDSRPWSSHAIDALTKYDSIASNIGISIAFCSRVTYRTNNPVALKAPISLNNSSKRQSARKDYLQLRAMITHKIVT